MRHLAPLVVVLVAICTSSTAFAADHLMRVDEVLLSQGGNTAVQFIELDDPGLEPFPSNPYGVEIYNAAGTKVGNTVQLTVPPDTQRLFIATAAADPGSTRDGTLPATLPADGQACFVRVMGAGNQKIMCLAWGCITTQIVAPVMLRAPSPPDNQSVQRQTNGTYQLAAPTPDATNVAGTLAANCPTEPDAAPTLDGPINADAGVTPDAGSGSGGNNNGDDEGGCCQVEGSRGAAGACLLAFVVLVLVNRRRRA